MENLNAEEIKCGLEHCTAKSYKCEECPYFYKSEGIKSSMEILMTDALALINSQEQRIKELTDENERLKEHLAIEQSYKERLQGILLEFTDIVHKWGNKYGYDTSEISLVPILNEGTEIKKQIRADTVRKMQTEIEARCIKGGIYPAFVKSTIDKVAKEMLEGKQ